mmetsp:Transcript_5680/g.6719  ORF Transcript_5680/g.6719 Transcript_5680/m.6719 type:complete len:825 (-) Transcript_5680:495-2969(-)|eukprot:CAMPEP_0204871086 /NCGR_PEP_ID=MMETSP1348-20121228/34409_1 /ASSEMBLY_ACC=CAM_ASM_000700 /TAXON_ID=215587 /ORGANISM="Aplanochytrium stocchinoi, Strain GSBS06" /LENGTH=824 /DNA_ID=CAMNT_0052025223 /DNA_START=104 /DNA_END=2578 /DNA_ORIENTATION=-
MEDKEKQKEKQNQTNIFFHNSGAWETDYHRNNKQSGAKNLRCFPYCRDPHRDQGFCGQPVQITIRRKTNSDVSRELYVWAEFMTVKQFEELSDLGIKYKETEIKAKVRSRKHRFLPWFAGEVGEEETLEKQKQLRIEPSVDFTIKSQKSGWNYMFLGNKHTGKILHCLVIRVFAKSHYEDDVFECIGTHKSPEFRIYSCRRKFERRGRRNSEITNEIVKRGLEVKSVPPIRSLEPGQEQKRTDEEQNTPSNKNQNRTLQNKNKKQGHKQKMILKKTERMSVSEYKATGDNNDINDIKAEGAFEGAPLSLLPLKEQAEAHTPVEISLKREYSNSDLLIPDPFEADNNYTFLKSVPSFPDLTDGGEGEDGEAFDYRSMSLDNALFASDICGSLNIYTSTLGRGSGRKRAICDDDAEKLDNDSFDFDKVPDCLEAPFPLRPLNYDYDDTEDYEIPPDVMPLFGYHNASNYEQYAVRKSMWAICIILTVLDSHWRSYPEMFTSKDESDAKGERLKKYSFSLPAEPRYENPIIKAAFIEVAKVFASMKYQVEILEISQMGVGIVAEKEKAYVAKTLMHFDKAVRKIGMSLGTFLGLFYMRPPKEVVDSAKRRLRSINGYLRSGVVIGYWNHEFSNLKGNSNVTSRNDRSPEHRNMPRAKMMPFRIDGVWRVDDMAMSAVNHIRVKYLKTSWIMRQLWAKVEKEYVIETSGEDTLVSYSTLPMFKHAVLKYKLDGVTRKYLGDSFNFPLAQPAAMTYRCFWDNVTLVMEVFFGLDQSAKFFRRWDPLFGDGDSLDHPKQMIYTVGYATFDASTNEWTCLYEANGSVHRIR